MTSLDYTDQLSPELKRLVWEFGYLPVEGESAEQFEKYCCALLQRKLWEEWAAGHPDLKAENLPWRVEKI
jgi:hypothetical protein